MNIKNLRSSMAAAVGGAVLLAGLLVGASFALAQESDEPGATEQNAEETHSDDGFGFLDDRSATVGEHLDDFLADMGLNAEEIKEQLAAGATVEDILADAGINLDGVVEQVRESVMSGIDEAVADGHLNEEQGAAIKEQIEKFDLGEVGPFGGHQFGPMPLHEDFNFRGFGFGDFDGLDGVFEDLELDFDALREQMESGATLDEALDSSGIDLEALADEARAEALAHLDEMVAEGHMSQEQADSIEEMLNGIDFSDGIPFGLGGFRFGDDWPPFDIDGERPGHGFGFFHHGEGDGDRDAE